MKAHSGYGRMNEYIQIKKKQQKQKFVACQILHAHLSAVFILADKNTSYSRTT